MPSRTPLCTHRRPATAGVKLGIRMVVQAGVRAHVRACCCDQLISISACVRACVLL